MRLRLYTISLKINLNAKGACRLLICHTSTLRHYNLWHLYIFCRANLYATHRHKWKPYVLFSVIIYLINPWCTETGVLGQKKFRVHGVSRTETLQDFIITGSVKTSGHHHYKPCLIKNVHCISGCAWHVYLPSFFLQKNFSHVIFLISFIFESPINKLLTNPR